MLADLVLAGALEEVTLAERCPICAPPGPMASAMDWGCGDGAAAALFVGSGEGCAVLLAADGGVAEGEAVAEAEGAGGVGAGLGSRAKAGPVRPGPTTRASASGTTPRYFRNGVRD